jgi:hypothetical protein
MKRLFPILCSVVLFLVTHGYADAKEADSEHHQGKECCKKPGDGACNLEKRGWCGKRKGDWYGARRPVHSREDARDQLVKYYSPQQKTVAVVAEKQWRFEADLLDNCGKVVDRVMIDKRSGRIRSIY